MCLSEDKRARWRYTRGLFLFLDRLKSSLTHSYLALRESDIRINGLSTVNVVDLSGILIDERVILQQLHPAWIEDKGFRQPIFIHRLGEG